VSISVMRLHSRADFQAWIDRDSDVRNELDKFIATRLGTATASLDVLEQFLLTRYRNVDDALAINERPVIDAAARHVGLVMLLNVNGAEWAIELGDEDSVHHGLPIIFLSDGEEACPLLMVAAGLDRRTGHSLRETVEVFEQEYSTSKEN